MRAGRSRSHSRSSTSSVLSLSSFGDVGHESAMSPTSPEAEAPRSDSEVESELSASCKLFRHSDRFFLTDKVVRFLVRIIASHHTSAPRY